MSKPLDNEAHKRMAERMEVMRQVFTRGDGQRVLEWLKEELGFYTTSFNPDNTDPMLTAYNEGRRSVILGIHQVVTADPDEELKNASVTEPGIHEQYWPKRDQPQDGVTEDG